MVVSDGLTKTKLPSLFSHLIQVSSKTIAYKEEELLHTVMGVIIRVNLSTIKGTALVKANGQMAQTISAFGKMERKMVLASFLAMEK